MYLSEFVMAPPKHLLSQEEAISWLSRLRAEAEGEPLKAPLFYEKLAKIGIGEGKVQTRGCVFADPTGEGEKLFSFANSKWGCSMEEKMALYAKEAEEAFEKLYPSPALPSPFLLHVTCTGYVMPSPAQKWVAKQGLGEDVWVHHIYHMGCYAAIPAIQLAASIAQREGKSADIVHTELCSLHINPLNHSTEQMVIESLFADGFVRYQVGAKAPPIGFRIVALKQEILPETSDRMTWTPASWGMAMTLDKRVPLYLARALSPFLERLAEKANLTRDELEKGIFAIHPGGPKIIENIAELLSLEKKQWKQSLEVLQEHGNMSSATLPHIWGKIAQDNEVKSGTLITSLAFGPGLTITGAILEKV